MIQPFDYNPFETKSIGGSITVPAGEYWKITPKEFNAAVIVDGFELFPQLAGIVAYYTDSNVYQTVLEGNSITPIELRCYCQAENGAVPVYARLIDIYGGLIKYDKFGNTHSGEATFNSSTWSTDPVTDGVVLNYLDRIQLRAGNPSGPFTAGMRLTWGPVGPVTAPSFWVEEGAVLSVPSTSVEVYKVAS